MKAKGIQSCPSHLLSVTFVPVRSNLYLKFELAAEALRSARVVLETCLLAGLRAQSVAFDC